MLAPYMEVACTLLSNPRPHYHDIYNLRRILGAAAIRAIQLWMGEYFDRFVMGIQVRIRPGVFWCSSITLDLRFAIHHEAPGEIRALLYAMKHTARSALCNTP